MPKGVYARVPTPWEARFWVKVNKTEACWVWMGARSCGYGQFTYNKKSVRAHRHSYESVRGPIPEELEIDHLCRNPACVNPSHLEAVTPSENTKRAVPYRKQKPKCVRGHDMTGPNLRRRGGTGWRRCAECHRGYYKKKEAGGA